jgi:hypothetical protein
MSAYTPSIVTPLGKGGISDCEELDGDVKVGCKCSFNHQSDSKSKDEGLDIVRYIGTLNQ